MNALTFNGVNLTPIVQNSQVWLTSFNLAKALGYSREDEVTRIYSRHADEFTPSMTLVANFRNSAELSVVANSTENTTLAGSGNLQKKVRIFSLRGAHLIAMFSRTAVAKDFRIWVLDILDREVTPAATISPSQQRALLDLVRDRSHGFGRHMRMMWSKHNRHFALGKYSQLPAEKFSEACEYLMSLPEASDSEVSRGVWLSEQEASNLFVFINMIPDLTGKLGPVIKALDSARSPLVEAVVNMSQCPRYVLPVLKEVTSRCKLVHESYCKEHGFNEFSVAIGDHKKPALKDSARSFH